MLQKNKKKSGLAVGAGLLLSFAQAGFADSAQQESPADARAREVEQKMTNEERYSLLYSLMPVNLVFGGKDKRVSAEAPLGAGYVPGVPRLGVPALAMTDASLGVTNPHNMRSGDSATALPAGLALGATFNPELAREAGAMVGREARSKGFNVLLGGGMNLARDPRNGRNFEYISEDPLLSARIAAGAIIGTQSEGVISMLKHLSLNGNETNRHWLNAVIDEAAHRESDLLAFQMAIEQAQPGSIMCAYNKVNGEYSCGSDYLLNGVLKRDWGYNGWVMSDWGAVQDWSYALKGLDQESGAQLDKLVWGKEWFNEPLQAVHAEGKLPDERLSDMVRRILRSIYAVGADKPVKDSAIDLDQHNQIALEVARQGIVLLKNDGVLPLQTEKPMRIAVIGGMADTGVLSGSGSSQVTPLGGFAAVIPVGGEGIMAGQRKQSFFPSAPKAKLQKLMPKASITYDPGAFPVEAAALAKQADVVILFATRHEAEGFDSPDLSLPFGQDALIDAVASANPNTVVVLQTGNPVDMPWHTKVKAIVEAWYPGQAGGQAIAEVLTGQVNPSGHLPVTFPADIAQTPRPKLPGFGTPFGTPLTVNYSEGAEVGYRWFAQQDEKPLFAFGHGLSYTSFTFEDLKVSGGETITASFTVTNTGKRKGIDVPQLYLTDAAGDKRVRLLGFERLELEPGEARRVSVEADPRLLARFDTAANQWHIKAGEYRVALGESAQSLLLRATTRLVEQHFAD